MQKNQFRPVLIHVSSPLSPYSAANRCFFRLSLQPSLLLIDGPYFKAYPAIKHQCIVRGDQQSHAIAAASMSAKVYRDQYMQELAKYVPVYAWEHNKGYPSKAHMTAMYELGITKHHRKSFSPVAQTMHANLFA